MLRKFAKHYLKRRGIKRKEAYLRMLDNQLGRHAAFWSLLPTTKYLSTKDWPKV